MTNHRSVFRLLSIAPVVLAAMWSMRAEAQPPPPADETAAPPARAETPPPPAPATTTPPPLKARDRPWRPYRADTQFDDSLDIYVAPGAINLPYGGVDGIDYSDSFDPGYQWGFGVGWFERAQLSPFALGVGAFFDHALINPEDRLSDGDLDESLFRAGLELRPGFVAGERFFFYIPIRAGYAADVLEIGDDDAAVSHGLVVGVAGALDIALLGRCYIGTAIGTDLHFFRAGSDVNAFLLSWRTHIGFRF